MKTVKIYFLHELFQGTDFLYDFYQIPRDKYNLVWDDKNPDYVIASEWIYRDTAHFKKFLELQNENTINIFHAGECISPDLNFFDYAIVFDRNLADDDRIIRMPTIDFFKRRLFPEFWQPCPDAHAELARKTNFCCFIYTNANAHPRRDQLFHKLSEYKKVDALGTHLRNVDLTEKFVDEKIKRNYKFTIASENATFRGYTSEKLLTALQAYTVPIYWGDPSVAESFNPKRFINANNMTLDEVLETVKKIDADDELWCKIVSEPVMTPKQEQKYQDEHQKYMAFWDNIFNQPLNTAKRIGFGTHPNLYRQFITNLIKQPTEKRTKKYLGGIVKKIKVGNKRTIKIFGIKILDYTKHSSKHST